MATIDTEVRRELLDATDETIEDAVKFADPMVLRGLLYQLTGDEEIAATTTRSMVAGFGEATIVATDAEVALLQRKAAEFLKAYRDAGAGDIAIGPEERLPISLGLAVG